MDTEHHLLIEGVLAFCMLVREAVWSLRAMRLRADRDVLRELQREVDMAGGLGAESPGAAAPRPDECPRCGWVDGR